MGEERKTYGTAAVDEPVTRDDFERALRSLHLNDLDLRDLVVRLAAQVVALTEELGVTVGDRVPKVLDRIRAADVSDDRVWLETDIENKYHVEGAAPPCDELMHLCQARCCKLKFALSTADLDEGVIRWDYGQPYMIRQRASDGYCVHNDPTSHGCTVHAQRPAICRRYHCQTDSRIWLDYDKRIIAPPDHPGSGESPPIDLMERVQQNQLAELVERSSIRHTYPEDDPRVGPDATPRPPRKPR